jgi:hypothetical protein
MLMISRIIDFAGYESLTCQEIDFLGQAIGVANYSQKAFSTCVSPETVVSVEGRTHGDIAAITSSSRSIYALSSWLAIVLHIVGVELYVSSPYFYWL